MALSNEDRNEIENIIDRRIEEKLLPHETRMFLIDEQTRDRVGRIEVRLDGVDGRLDGIDGRLDGIDGRIDAMDLRFGGIDARLEGIDGRLDGIERSVDAILVTQRGTNDILREVLDRLPGD